MGLFSKVSGPDWATAPITGVPQWQRHEAPRPDSLATVSEAIRLSRVDPREVDRIECLVVVWRLISGMGQHYMRAAGAQKAADGFALVSERDDISEELLWNYFSHHDAVGVAAQRRVVEAFESGEVAELIASRIREGGCRVGLGGKDRI